MKKVNLSKLHKLINRLESEIRESQEGITMIGVVRYTPKTSESKVSALASQLVEGKEQAIAFTREKIALLPYLAMLKHTLHTKNNEAGIDKLMIEASNASKEYSLMRGLSEKLQSALQYRSEDYESMSHEEILSILDPEKNPYVQRKMSGVTKEDLLKLRQEMKEIENKKVDIEDEIARLNQTTLVEIPTREEFLR